MPVNRPPWTRIPTEPSDGTFSVLLLILYVTISITLIIIGAILSNT